MFTGCSGTFTAGVAALGLLLSVDASLSRSHSSLAVACPLLRSVSVSNFTVSCSPSVFASTYQAALAFIGAGGIAFGLRVSRKKTWPHAAFPTPPRLALGQRLRFAAGDTASGQSRETLASGA